jgi:hypothetical protein
MRIRNLQRNRIAVAAFLILFIAFAMYGLSKSVLRIHGNYTEGQVAFSGASLSSSTTLEEAEGFDASANPAYWLNSGAYAYFSGVSDFATLHGDLPPGSKWQQSYMNSNSIDTDGGIHPQNLFRLFTKDMYGNGSYVAYAKIDSTIKSLSPNRNDSNGVFLMIHAKDSDNLYYAGLRVDGNAVIKKKIGGIYYTLAEVPVFAYAAYDTNTMPSVLPLKTWLGMKADVRTVGQGNVDIIFSIDLSGAGIWIPLLHITDMPSQTVQTLPDAGHAGIRSDFMEMEIKDFKVSSL